MGYGLICGWEPWILVKFSYSYKQIINIVNVYELKCVRGDQIKELKVEQKNEFVLHDEHNNNMAVSYPLEKS